MAAKGLKASDILAHPGFKHQAWNLPPADEGFGGVAANRPGGPFKLWYQVHGEGQTRVVVSAAFLRSEFFCFSLSSDGMVVKSPMGSKKQG